MNLLKSDALKNTSPVSREVTDASEISQKFDEISYAKGASLIRMLNHTITEKIFQNGLLRYLNKWFVLLLILNISPDKKVIISYIIISYQPVAFHCWT